MRTREDIENDNRSNRYMAGMQIDVQIMYSIDALMEIALDIRDLLQALTPKEDGK